MRTRVRGQGTGSNSSTRSGAAAARAQADQAGTATSDHLFVQLAALDNDDGPDSVAFAHKVRGLPRMMRA